jgi:hypothetical protein
MKKKSLAIFELMLIVLSIFSFSYLVSPDPTRIVSADEGFSGCCLETQEGAICQNIPSLQSNLCKTSLIGTGCEVVDQCNLGCCYSPNTGTCAMRAPKEQCLTNGGNWSSDASCNIPSCQLGCCVMGDQVSLTNSRECTLLSNKFNFDKFFSPIVPGENCDKYMGLDRQGACLIDSGDYSGEKKCSFTTKKNCNGEFKEDYLCTSQELNTVCQKTKKTTCVDGKDQVYFLDSCGNVANVYDSSKVNDQNYWERPIDPKDSCAKEGIGCGNCDYFGGSICAKYESSITKKPDFGDYICKSLNCGERKHGESWCVYDFNPNSGVSPVGSRHFLANCFEGQISIEGCADFNQEICAQSTDTSLGFTEAKCLVNDWRSCINANDASSYSSVKTQCDENPQCIMFNDFYGEDKLKRSDGEFFAGFDPERENSEQGAIGDLGRDHNKVLAHCVPRFTPGFQFWSTSNSIVGSGSSSKKLSAANYGGSNEETSALCSLGSFTCISQINRDCTLAGGCDDWEDNERNWECNYNGIKEIIKGDDLPKLLASLNERCRSLGSCGTSTNFNGFVNVESPGFSIERIKIDKKGKTHENFNSEGYVLSSNYLSSLKRSTPLIKKLDEIKSTSGGLMADAADSAGTSGTVYGNVINLNDLAKVTSVYNPDKFGDIMLGVGILSSLSFFGLGSLSTVAAGGFLAGGGTNFVGSLGGGGFVAITAIIGASIGFQIGNLISKNKDWSPGKQNQFNRFMAGVGATVGAGTGVAIMSQGVAASAVSGSVTGNFATFATIIGSNPFGWMVLAIAITYMIYEAFFNSYEEQEYFILQYTCEAWQPPKGGDCSVCNDDVRPCSEYRCKSLGSNCHYFIENGEPGYCEGINEIWSAQIKPWQEILTKGNQYNVIKKNGFRIQGSSNQGVEAWVPLTFGIITDKPAQCRIDFEHTKDYYEMKYQMFSPINPDNNKADGTYHFIGLNPYSGSESSSTTLGLRQGEENEYYIRCMNFAGQINEAEFVVQVKAKDGPDLTPPELRRFEPISGSYLKQGENSTDIILYLNEPAECRFDYEYDVLTGPTGFNELKHKMNCFNSPGSAIFGEWRCISKLENLTPKENNLYFRCKDQPNLEETESYPKNVNFVSTNYKLNVCSTGLEISLLNKKSVIEERNFTLSVATSGCLENSVCSFKMANYSKFYNTFLETGKKIHNQPLTLPQGEHSIEVSCEDEAKNKANETFNFSVYFDNIAPQTLRIINLQGKIEIITDEEAECMYETNKSLGCTFEFPSNSLTYLSKQHNFNSNPLETYFIKCRDRKLNVPQTCSIIIKPL